MTQSDLLTLYISVESMGQHHKAILDIGASRIYCIGHIVNQLSLLILLNSVYPRDPRRRSERAVKEKTEAQISIVNLSSTTYKTKFDILNSKKSVLILGMTFLTQNNWVINLENRIIEMGGRKFELPGEFLYDRLEATLKIRIS